TISHNPATPDNTPCLANLHKGESCLVTWTVVDVNDTTAEFYAIGVGENAPETESRHINVTVSGNNTIKPVMANVSISPSQPNDDDDLTCSALAIDNDSATLVVEFEWYVGDTHMPQYDSTETCTNGTVCNSSVKVPSSATSRDENWTCSVRAFDGTHYSDWMNDTVKITRVFPPENCTNGIDDDGDGLVDCNDPDCYGDPACRPPPSQPRRKRMEVELNSTCADQDVLITVKRRHGGYVDDAYVYVDDEYIGRTDEDGRIVARFSIGEHTLKVEKSGYDDYTYTYSFEDCRPPQPVCECSVDAQCNTSEYCDGCYCQELVCPPGLVALEHTCRMPPECMSDADCPETSVCINNTCQPVECECGYVENHTCIPYECCYDSQCGPREVCLNHTCTPITPEVTDETVLKVKGELDILETRLRELKKKKPPEMIENISVYEQMIEQARAELAAGHVENAEEILAKVRSYLFREEEEKQMRFFWALALGVTALLLLIPILIKRKKKKKKRRKQK
ncbi:hypothetical protein J7K41_01055, partial [Candidatus Micrarchaeota archaeon]|nr:hypothetical protein [Candidatus Micrarchaeota archaeon]